MGYRHLCGINPCPLLMRAKTLIDLESAVKELSLYGSSPPGVFVGEHGYPKVLLGPLIPPVLGPETAIMERPDLWLDKSMDEIISMRFSLVRTKRTVPVDAAIDPPRFLQETQTLALSEEPTDSEALLLKKPTFTSVLSDTTLPVGPSAPLDVFNLDDNPTVPRAVDKVTSDTDVRATTGIMELYDDGINQEHVTRLFSVGLLGAGRTRRIVPTKWSITAVDDIVGKKLHREVLRLPWMNDYEVYVDQALGNTVIILFMQGVWQFEALESWLSGPNPGVISDHEWFRGRKNYARSVAGAYYATRLPVLEHMLRKGRQASAIVFLETDPTKWVPLGVWRFRSIARRALSKEGSGFSTLEEAIDEVGTNLHSPLQNWLSASKMYENYKAQTTLMDFM
ncbi:MAG: Nre family DNA repair protein [Candidatus Thorarchaeota archaeon]